MESEKKEKNPFPQKDIMQGLLLNYLKLLSKFFNLYTGMPQSNSFPSKEELQDEQVSDKMKAKTKISLSILYKTAKKDNDEEIMHLIQYNQKLIEDPNCFKKMEKVNLMIGCAMTLIKIYPVKFNKKEIENLMVNYLQTIIKNFYYAYHNTIYGFYESISNSLCEINKCKFFFDYELVFIHGDDYFKKEVIPKIKEETSRLLLTFNEDIITEFELYEIDYTNTQSVFYYSNFLIEAKKFKEYQKNHTKDEYKQYKKDLKERLLKEANITLNKKE